MKFDLLNIFQEIICIPKKEQKNTHYYKEGNTPNSTSTLKQYPKMLLLVINAKYETSINVLNQKQRIELDDCKNLYSATDALWIGSKLELSEKRLSSNQFIVPKGKESEYDIYLVKIELRKSDERFEPKVNQLDRYDAFRDLANLSVNVEVSPRLRMEAYENIGVYSR